jgi:hypothetical protein
VGSWKKEKYISAKEQELLQPLDRTWASKPLVIATIMPNAEVQDCPLTGANSSPVPSSAMAATAWPPPKEKKQLFTFSYFLILVPVSSTTEPETCKISVAHWPTGFPWRMQLKHCERRRVRKGVELELGQYKGVRNHPDTLILYSGSF